MLPHDLRFRSAVVLILSLGCVNGVSASGPLFPGAQYDVGHRPASVAAGDLNDDGLSDLVTANRSDSDVSVLFNRCVLQATSHISDSTGSSDSNDPYS